MDFTLHFFKRKKYYVLSIVLMFFLSKNTLNAQCLGCTIAPPSSGNFTALAGETYCFNSNANLSDVILQDGSKICISAGVSLIINNNIQTQSTDTVTIIINGLLQFNQVPTINAKLGLVVHSTGHLKVGSTGNNNLSCNGANTNIEVDGVMDLGVLNFQNSSSSNLVEIREIGTMNIGGNINISGGTSFYNKGDLFIGASYNNNSTSIFINCGLMISTAGFNIGGGTVDNTGRFFVPTGSVDFGNSTGKFYNKGYTEVGNTLNINSSNHLYYNEGLLRTLNIQGDGKLEGPSSGGMGYIEVGNRPNLNSNVIGPNLDFTYYNGTTDNGDGRPTAKPGAGQNGTNINTNRQWVFGNFNGSFIDVNTISFSCRTIGNCTSPVDTTGSPCPNSDGSAPITINLDQDNDGILDVVESFGGDSDGDGIRDYEDPDFCATNFEGINGWSCGIDGLPDPDDDLDNDGIPNYEDPDFPTCGGIVNGVCLTLDLDGDGIPNHIDLDSDNDGIPDLVEIGGTDTNGDGVLDDLTDTDKDGLVDLVDNNDTDGPEGVSACSPQPSCLRANSTSILFDTNGDGVLDNEVDTDGDGILDYIDLDSDNDGIPDVVEAGGTDANGDGRIDNYIDVDADGFNDVVDGDVGNDGTIENLGNVLQLTGADINGDGIPDSYPNDDLDGDGIRNQLDLDADGDGILDVLEAGGTDANRDGIEDGFIDGDGDGFNDVVDGDPTNALVTGTDTNGANTGNATTVTGADTDGDGEPDTYPSDNLDGDNNYNFLDIDADNDGIVDNTEGQATSNYVARSGSDADGDGIDDAYDNDDANFGGAGSGIVPNNQDGIDNPDYLDLDTDNDGITDVIEGHDTNGDGVVNGADVPNSNTGLSGGLTDADGDGLLDGFDNNTASADPTNTSLIPNSHPDATNGITLERDWREGNRTYVVNDVNTTPLNVTASGNVLTNDYDQEGNTQTLSGNIEIDTDGDGAPETGAALGVGVTVGGVNEDGSANISAGTLTQNANGIYDFVPTAGFIGEVTYRYQACDNGSPQVCAVAEVIIDVEPAPTTDNGELALAPDVNTTHGDLAVSGQVLSNDNDPDGDNILVTGTIVVDTDGDGVVDATRPLNTLATIAGVDENGNPVTNAGSLTQNANGTYTFDPVADFVGVIEYIYTACDDGTPITCEQTTVTINVLPSLYNSTNAIDDEEFMDKGTTLTDNVLVNDSDVEGDNQVGGVSLVTGPTNGSLILNADGSYSYTPTNATFVGNDAFVYSVCDNGTPQMCDTATVYLTILDVNKDYSETGVYGVAWHRAMRDGNTDNVLDGGTDVWLGSQTDFETGSLALDNFDDGISIGAGPGQFPTAVLANQVFNLDITLNSTVADNVFYGLWIDWNNDGAYDDFYTGNVATASPTTTTVAVTVPSSYNGTETVNIRLRADDDVFVIGDFAGGRTNGEVEDYQALVVDLPVELLYFTAKLKDKNVGVLNWATENELNNAGYEVEHALPTGGIPVFEQIGYVNGAGTTVLQQFYNYEISRLVSGVHYFRLKQVDLDGTYVYTQIRALRIERALVQKLFPTVLHKGSNTVYIQVEKDDNYKIEVITGLGQVVESYTNQLQSSAYHELVLDINHYVSGVYFIRVSNNTNSFTEKIRIE